MQIVCEEFSDRYVTNLFYNTKLNSIQYNRQLTIFS